MTNDIEELTHRVEDLENKNLTLADLLIKIYEERATQQDIGEAYDIIRGK